MNRNLVTVGVISFSAILFQICVTRILAVTLWYHFAFLVISLSMLGMTAAAIACFVFWPRVIETQSRRYFIIFAALFALLAPLSVAVHLNINFQEVAFNTAGFYAIAMLQLVFLAAAFFAAGMALNIILFKEQERIGFVYFCDLIGAAAASLLVMALLYWVSPIAVVFLISFLSLWAAYVQASHQGLRLALLLSAGVMLVLFINNDAWHIFKIRAVKSYGEKAFQVEDKPLLFEKWSPFARTTVYSPTRHDSGTLSIENNSGAPAAMFKYDPMLPPTQLRTRLYGLQEMAFVLKKSDEALIIGSGGGRNLLAALLSGQGHITAVEVNPVTAEIVTKDFSDYIGRIFEDSRVTFHVQEGRNFIARTQQLYDVINISMVESWGNQAAASNSYIFTENTLYTREAVWDYVRHLNPQGILSITRYDDFDEGLRLVNTMIDTLQERGEKDLKDQFVVVLGYKYRGSVGLANVMYKRGGFTREDVARIRDFTSRNGFKIIYAPFLPEAAMSALPRSEFYRKLILGKDRRDDLVARYPRIISPSTDDKPFFFYMDRFKDSFVFNANEHAARRRAIPILYGLCAGVAVLSLIMVFLPLLVYRRTRLSTLLQCRVNLLYFAALGTGFMFIELSLIQRLTVFLGHPIYALIVVLTALLLSSAMGSFFSGRIKPLMKEKVLKVVLLAIALCGVLVGGIMFDHLARWMYLQQPLRVIVAVATIVPLGAMLGMCFPLGVHLLQEKDRQLIVWAWGINGIFSVLGSVLAMVLALHMGFKAVFLIGAACYCGAWLAVKRMGNQ